MIGAIVGDVIGSAYEFDNVKTKKFPLFTRETRFTDDTVMTCAVAESLMRSTKNDYKDLEDVAIETFHEVGRRHPACGFGGRFYRWMMGDVWVPYGSCGNGSAMRISPVGDIAKTPEEAIELANVLTRITHDHPEGLKGAEAAAVAKVMLKGGVKLNRVESFIDEYYYKMDKTVSELRAETDGHGAELCQVSMPQAFTCLFDGVDFEDVIRNCVSIGGDSDTVAAIAGGIAEAIYPVPEEIKELALSFLTPDLLDIVERWERFTGGKEG